MKTIATKNPFYRIAARRIGNNSALLEIRDPEFFICVHLDRKTGLDFASALTHGGTSKVGKGCYSASTSLEPYGVRVSVSDSENSIGIVLDTVNALLLARQLRNLVSK